MVEIILTERVRKYWDRLKAGTGLEMRFWGEKVFEAYAGQATPAAYRVFWYFGPEKNRITVIAITPHP